MIEQIKMPQLGESVTEGTISKWLVTVGDRVNKYEPLAEVMTDKVSAEIPSSFSGIIKELIAPEGETLLVGEVICTLEVEGGNAATTKTVQNEAEQIQQKAELTPAGKGARFSPAVLKLSQEHGIDLQQVKGTGAGGRITRKDLLLLVDSGNIPTATKVNVEPPLQTVKSSKASQTFDTVIERNAENIVSAPGDVEIPISGVRKAIAGNMLRSKHEIPHAWTMIEVDATNLVNYRNEMKNEFKKTEGFNLTFFPFFVKAVSQALREFPQLNSTWAGDKIIQKKDINISIAVATDDALFVPVIKNVDEKTIKGIGKDIVHLAKKARGSGLSVEDMQGGTFTINNTGSFGSIQSVGIINYPQAAILQVESIVKRPVVINGMIAIRDMVNLCLSLDHRVLDGLVCGRFLQRVKEIIENFSKENTSIY
ncbi:dihydrolipoamide acetyltransferase family protein [Bacillus sp. 03113]|uniref:dihydrolipoamide acetyltransferase family protein n=1 Tax=Bacillus sp. 03113 TaxID=2578211 RepID=UPI001143EBCD|nr:dihydrolipoamide acetyltransferase family protein [Bacillus sp. 03113]